MNTSNQIYKKLTIPHFKEVFDIIDAIMHQHHTPYYLIGASAVALELLKNDIKPGLLPGCYGYNVDTCFEKQANYRNNQT